MDPRLMGAPPSPVPGVQPTDATSLERDALLQMLSGQPPMLGTGPLPATDAPVAPSVGTLPPGFTRPEAYVPPQRSGR